VKLRKRRLELLLWAFLLSLAYYPGPFGFLAWLALVRPVMIISSLEGRPAFNAAYDASANYKSTFQSEMAEGKSAISELSKTIRAWLPVLARDIPSFDSSDFNANPAIPDDVLNEAERLCEIIETVTARDTTAIPYAAALLSALDTEVPTRGWAEAEAADSTYQKMMAEVRSTADAFDSELQLYRRTLLAVLGRSDRDYQKLRATKAAAADADDDPSAPPPVESVVVAPPDVTGPTA